MIIEIISLICCILLALIISIIWSKILEKELRKSPVNSNGVNK